MRKLFIGENGVNRQIKLPIKAVFLSAAMVALGFTAAAKADTVLGQFTLTNYYTPTSPTASTPTDPNHPLSATVTFTYLSPSVNGGDNLAVTIANTSTPLSSNELIRDVVFQISNQGALLTATPTSSTTYLATDADEYSYSGSSSYMAAGTTLSYPWTIGASATYAKSYDLSSQKQNSGANLDMIGPPNNGSLNDINNTVGGGNLAPVLIPYGSNSSIIFDVNIPNLSDNATVRNIYIGYGDTTTINGLVPLGGYVEIPSSAAAVPEPSIGAAVGAMLAVAGLLIHHRRA